MSSVINTGNGMSPVLNGIRNEFIAVRTDINAIADIVGKLEKIVRDIAVKTDVSCASLDGVAETEADKNYYAAAAAPASTQVAPPSIASSLLRRR